MQITAGMQSRLNTGAAEHQWFVWIKAKNRDTGAAELVGLWSGDYNITVSVDGVARTYYGAGLVMSVPSLQYKSGVDIQTHRLQLAILSPEVTNVIRAYDSRLAAIEVHLGIFDPVTGVLSGISKALDGTIDEIDISESETDASVEIGVVSSLRKGSKTLSLMKSDSSQRLRDESDEGFKYSSIAGSVSIQWGTGEGWKAPNWR